jgi:hypothetical protein
MLYTLKAAVVLPTGDTATEALAIIADNDLIAACDAIYLALDFANNRPDSPWATGHVTMLEGERTVLQTIPAAPASIHA